MIIKIFMILAWVVYAGAAYAGITRWIIPTELVWTKVSYSAMLAGLAAGLAYATKHVFF